MVIWPQFARGMARRARPRMFSSGVTARGRSPVAVTGSPKAALLGPMKIPEDGFSGNSRTRDRSCVHSCSRGRTRTESLFLSLFFP